MLPAQRARWGIWAPAAVLLVVFFLQCLLASLQKSPTFDETGDIAAGLSYWQTGGVWLNLQHPPLIKRMQGLPLWLAGLRLPPGPLRQGWEREIGAKFIAANGPDRVMLLARLPMIILATAFGLLLFLWGRETVGDRAALAALFLYSFDPNVIAHSALATMDVGFAAFTVLFLFALWRYLRHPDLKHVGWTGATLGLVLATKFSALFLLPIAAILVIAAGRNWRDAARDLALMGVVAAVVLQVVYLTPSGLYLYRTGVGMVNRDHNPNYMVFMAGQFDHRFLSYFLVAWLLKEPLATILCALAGLWFLLRGKEVKPIVKLFLLLPPAVLLLAHTFLADNLGIRYILPVLPFGFLLGGIALARMPRAAAAVLGIWVILAAAGIWPDHLSYFNESACLLKEPAELGLDDGSKCGIYWLDDSNVDWGQGYKQLKAWMDRNGAGRTIRLMPFGSFPPSAYGFPVQVLSEVPPKPEPGLYGASAVVVARLPGTWLQTTPPAAIVGHAIYIYEVK